MENSGRLYGNADKSILSGRKYCTEYTTNKRITAHIMSMLKGFEGVWTRSRHL